MATTKYHLTGLAILLLYTTRRCEGNKIRELSNTPEDIKTKAMLTREVRSWNDAPGVLRFLPFTEERLGDATVYKIKYKAINGGICEGEIKKVSLGLKTSQKSHKFSCHKEELKRRRIHDVLDEDKPMFREDDSKDDPDTALESRSRKAKSKKKEKKEKELAKDYDTGNVKDVEF